MGPLPYLLPAISISVFYGWRRPHSALLQVVPLLLKNHPIMPEQENCTSAIAEAALKKTGIAHAFFPT